MELSRGSLSMKSNICEIQVLMPASTQLQQRPSSSQHRDHVSHDGHGIVWLACGAGPSYTAEVKTGLLHHNETSRTTWAHRRPSAIQRHARSSLSQSGDADSGREGV